MTIVDCAVYEEGRRRDGHVPLEKAYDACRRDHSAWVWIGLVEPTMEEFDSVKREFELHELAVEDAVKAHQRPKLELYGDSLFIVLKTAHYHETEEVVEFGEILLFVGAGFIISVRHGQAAELHGVRKTVEESPERLRCGPSAALHAIIDRVVDEYEPVLAGIEDDIEEVEEELFSPSRTNSAQRIYKLKREATEMHRATAPLMGPLEQLSNGQYELVEHGMLEYFRDVYDHLLRANEVVDGFRDSLASALNANLTQVSVRQNDDMRKISAWAAILAVPTVIAGVYGMNFQHMPELKWTAGYPLAVGGMLLICFVLYRVFKRAGWL
ncbi:MAG: magnesium/cobalt transporter CorA [Gaiellaceae bacterium]